MIEKSLGRKRTSESQLREAGRLLFGSQFKGVFASDDPYPKRGFSIINTDARASGGVHWLAYADGTWYDSFGRLEYGDESADAEQKISQRDCGQRSLAWLCVVKTHGIRFAKLI